MFALLNRIRGGAFVALFFRGMLWYGLPFGYLLIKHKINTHLGIFSILWMALALPIAVLLGRETRNWLNVKHFNGYWEKAEAYFGFALDILLIILYFSIKA